MLPAKQRRTALFLGIAIISLGGFSIVNSLEIMLPFKAYGILTVCQIGFLLFFLSRIRFKNDESAKTKPD
jgi:amino acid transporter